MCTDSRRQGREFPDLAASQLGDPTDQQWLHDLAHASTLEGLIAEGEEQWLAAESGYRECLRVLGFPRDVRLEPKALEGLGESLCQQGDRIAAADAYRDAQHIYERLGTWDESKHLWEPVDRLVIP